MQIKWIPMLALGSFGLGFGGFNAWARQQPSHPARSHLALSAPSLWLAQATSGPVEVVSQQSSQTSQNQRCSSTIHYPQVKLPGNQGLQTQINTYLKQQLHRSQIEYLQPFDLESCAAKIQQQDGITSFSETVQHSVDLNRNGILSLRYYAAAIQKQSAPAQDSFMFYTPTQALTINLKTGQVYQYADLFLPGKTINSLIEQRTQAKYGIKPGSGRGSTPTSYSFYLDQRGLVIFNIFPQRSLAAAHLVINPADIADVINPQGPLSALLP